MNKIFATVFFVIFIICGATAQSASRLNTSGKAQLGREGKFLLDSTWIYLGNAYGEQWFNFERYRVTERDQYGNFVSSLTTTFDTSNMVWYDRVKYEASYYDSITPLIWLARIWDDKGSSWRMSDSVYYNTQGAPVISWYKVWNPFSFRFSRGKRVVYQYLGPGQYLQQNIQRFDTISGSWSPDAVKKYTYNQQELLSELLIEKYDTTGNWADSLKINYTYNQENDLVEEIHQEFTGSFFLNYRKYTFSYSVPGKLREEYRYEWNNLNQSWKATTHLIYTYNENQQLAEILEKYWDDYENRWIDKDKTSYTYNALGKRTEVLQQFYDPINQYWFFTSKYNYTYDDNGNRLEYIYRFWDEQNAEWLDIYKDENFWSFFEPYSIIDPELKINIYPNPVQNNLIIELSGFEKRTCTIHSVDGKLVNKNILKNGINKLDFSGIVPGTYVLTIESDKKPITKKIIVK